MHLYLIVQIDYMQDVQELTFVLVKSLNLYIEDGVRVYFYAVVLEDVSNKGGGNMINMEQLYNFDPDVVLVTDAAALEIIETEAAWQELRAVKDGRVYTVPCDPYCWLSAPPSMNMILGVWWLGNLLYPEVYDYDMTAKAQEIYKVFWNYDLTAEEAAAMLG